MSDVIIPSSPADRTKLKQMLAEMTHCMQRADDEKEQLKEIATEAASQFNIPKKMINKLAKTMYKRSYEDLQAENEDFELLYEVLVMGKKTTDAEAA